MPRPTVRQRVIARLEDASLSDKEKTADAIARHVGTSAGNVYNIRSEWMRKHAEKNGHVPGTRRPPVPPRGEDDDAGGGGTPATSETQPGGLRLVSIQQIPPPPPPKPVSEGYECDQCGHRGEGKPPAACPKCGGA